jgi:hypothetical protein
LPIGELTLVFFFRKKEPAAISGPVHHLVASLGHRGLKQCDFLASEGKENVSGMLDFPSGKDYSLQSGDSSSKSIEISRYASGRDLDEASGRQSVSGPFSDQLKSLPCIRVILNTATMETFLRTSESDPALNWSITLIRDLSSLAIYHVDQDCFAVQVGVNGRWWTTKRCDQFPITSVRLSQRDLKPVPGWVTIGEEIVEAMRREARQKATKAISSVAGSQIP